MTEKSEFRNRIKGILEEIGSDVLSYDEAEFWMVEAVYDQIEFYAMDHCLTNTAIALPLARGLHDGTHRKSQITKNGLAYHMPYLIHPMLVCRMLMDLQLPLSSEEEDIVLASALCHDMIEDLPFTDGGRELYKKYHLDPRVYDTVKLVSKRRDFTEAQEREFFDRINRDRFALLIKLSDRGNNVEDLYNMSIWKIHEYVGETKKFFLPMCQYGLMHFPELYQPIEILLDKIVLLTETSETLIDRYEAEEKRMMRQEKAVREENGRLRGMWQYYLQNGQMYPESDVLTYREPVIIEDSLEEDAFDLPKEAYECEDLYNRIETYGNAKNLQRTLYTLHTLKESLIDSSTEEDLPVSYGHYKHALLAVMMLMDLHPVLSHDDEDITLAVILSHVLHELLPFDEYPNVFRLDEQVFADVKRIARKKNLHAEEKFPRFEAVRDSRTAVLACLADQSIHVQQMFRMTIWQAQDQIRETRCMVMPLCIAARERYPELYPVISILMEKMRSLMEVTDILSARYQERKKALTKEVFGQMEENARLWGLLQNAVRKNL